MLNCTAVWLHVLSLLLIHQIGALAATLAPTQPRTALLVVDVQPCFMPGGSLPTPGGLQVLDVIIRLLRNSPGSYAAVAFSLDCHPPNHISFASTHHMPPEAEPLQLVYTSTGGLCNYQHLYAEPLSVSCPEEAVEQAKRVAAAHLLPGSCATLVAVNQTLWPSHCVYGTAESQMHPQLSALLEPATPDTPPPDNTCTAVRDGDGLDSHMCHDVLEYRLSGAVAVPVLMVLKARQPHIDAYSSFYDNGHLSHTGLHDALSRYNITHLHIVGLALDVCVAATALDGLMLGYEVTVVQDGCQPVSEQHRQQVLEQLQVQGVNICNSDQLRDAA